MWLCLLIPTIAAAEFREITLSDARLIRGEILESSDTGLRLQLHQGVTFISYQDVVDIQDIDEAGWRGADRVWTAAVPPFAAGDPALEDAADRALTEVGRALSGFPGVRTVRPDEPGLTSTQADAIVACGGDPRCVLAPARDAGLDLVVIGAVERPATGADLLTLTAVFTASDRARYSASIPWDSSDERAPVIALNALYSVLGLEPDPERVQALIGDSPAPPPPAVAVPSPTPAAPQLSQGQVLGLSFVPIPGFPSLYQRDLKRFGLSWAAVIPAAALYVGVAEASSLRRGQLIELGIAGYYVSCVAVNQIMGIYSLEDRPLLALRPLAGGGVAEFTVPLP